MLVIFICEKEVTNDLVRRSKADALMRVTELKPKGHYKLTVLTNGCLPPTYCV